jgi:hypothetical protein
MTVAYFPHAQFESKGQVHISFVGELPAGTTDCPSACDVLASNRTRFVHSYEMDVTAGPVRKFAC